MSENVIIVQTNKKMFFFSLNIQPSNKDGYCDRHYTGLHHLQLPANMK